MAGSVNKVIIIGNLGRDPEVRTFQNGGKVCNLASPPPSNGRTRTPASGAKRPNGTRSPSSTKPLARVAEQYLRKGSKVYIEGQLETRKWQDQSGQDRYSTEVVLRPYRSELTMLDGRAAAAVAVAATAAAAAIRAMAAATMAAPHPPGGPRATWMTRSRSDPAPARAALPLAILRRGV